MEAEYKLFAYENNHLSLFAVQGEENGRTFVFDIVEKSGVVRPTSNAPATDLMLDLTGYEATFYGVYKDGSAVSCSGTLASDPTTGVVSFTLTEAFTVYAESLDCAIVLTQTGQELKIVGITLNVEPFTEDGSAPQRPQPISFYLGTTRTETLTLKGSNGLPYDITSGQSLVLTVKSGAEAVITKTVTANNGTAGEYDFVFAVSDTSELSAGTYTYSIMLVSSSENIPVVIPSPFTLLAI